MRKQLVTKGIKKMIPVLCLVFLPVNVFGSGYCEDEPSQACESDSQCFLYSQYYCFANSCGNSHSNLFDCDTKSLINSSYIFNASDIPCSDHLACAYNSSVRSNQCFGGKKGICKKLSGEGELINCDTKDDCPGSFNYCLTSVNILGKTSSKDFDYGDCYEPPVDRDGGWSDFGACNVSCGQGTRTRTCTNPSPSGNGADCSGLDGGNSTITCDAGTCCSPSHKTRSGSWGSCSKTCGGGTQYRSCAGSISCGGIDKCTASYTRPSQSCNTHSCAECGSSNGDTTSSPPSTNLCDPGTASTVTTNPSTYSRTCTESGMSVPCSSLRKRDADCGSAITLDHEIAPSTNLCSPGTAGTVTENEQSYTRTCDGVNGGEAKECTANRKRAGVCGDAQGKKTENSPSSELCQFSSSSSVTTEYGKFTWSCDGIFGGNSTPCESLRTRDGECMDHLGFYENNPATSTTNGCDLNFDSILGSSTYLSDTENDTHHKRQCQGIYDGQKDYCSALRKAKCGSAHQETRNSLPSSNVEKCDIGIAGSLTTTQTGYQRTCTNQAGNDAFCFSIREAECGNEENNSSYSPPSQNLCAAGIATIVLTEEANHTWSCENGGTNTIDCSNKRNRDNGCRVYSNIYNEQPATESDDACPFNYDNALGTSTYVDKQNTETKWKRRCLGVNDAISLDCQAEKESLPVGYFDEMSCLPYGRSCDANSFNSAVKIKLYANGNGKIDHLVHSYTANQNRADLGPNGVCGGTTDHGFSDIEVMDMNFIEALADNKNYTFRATATSIDQYGNELGTEQELNNQHVFNPSPCLCGNQKTERFEECDDGNNIDGDGCDNACKKETLECGLEDHYLLAYYPFQGHSYDMTKNSNDATAFGDLVMVDGQQGKTYAFDGSDDYFSIDNDPLFNVASSFTLSLWLNSEETQQASLLSKGAENDNGRELSLYDNILEFSLDGCGITLATEALSNNNRHHVAAVYDHHNNQQFIYIDGSANKWTTSLSGTNCNTNTSQLEIGAKNGGSFFEGMIDEVAIMNKALTSKEIENLYASSFSDICDIFTEEECLSPDVGQECDGNSDFLSCGKIQCDGTCLENKPICTNPDDPNYPSLDPAHPNYNSCEPCQCAQNYNHSCDTDGDGCEGKWDCSGTICLGETLGQSCECSNDAGAICNVSPNNCSGILACDGTTCDESNEKSIVGTWCDDGDPTTTYDFYDNDCHCVGSNLSILPFSKEVKLVKDKLHYNIKGGMLPHQSGFLFLDNIGGPGIFDPSSWIFSSSTNDIIIEQGPFISNKKINAELRDSSPGNGGRFMIQYQAFIEQ